MAMREPILIAGAGIGGMALALHLAHYGFSSRILEASPSPREEGGGIQLSPNAVHVLTYLGVTPLFSKNAISPDTLLVRTAKHGRILADINFRNHFESRYGASYLVLHRSDLHKALQARIQMERNLIDIRYGTRVTGYEEIGNTVQASTSSGEFYHGSILIGADGLDSCVRSHMVEKNVPRFSGYIAWRALLDSAQMEIKIPEKEIHLWLGKRAHLVVYTLGQKEKMVNVVAITRESSKISEVSDLFKTSGIAWQSKSFRGWHESTDPLLSEKNKWTRWPLFDKQALPCFHKGRIVLIGDAAHPTLPFLAQGAAMSLEDSAELAFHIRESYNQPDVAFKAFGAARIKRTARIQRHSRIQGVVYHLPEPLSIVRDSVMRLIGEKSLLMRQDWIYSWKHPDSRSS